MLKIPPDKEDLVARVLEHAWILGLGALMLLIGFVVLLYKLAPAALGG